MLIVINFVNPWQDAPIAGRQLGGSGSGARTCVRKQLCIRGCLAYASPELRAHDSLLYVLRVCRPCMLHGQHWRSTT